jgi:amino acid transporter
MRMLGEMALARPGVGSFTGYAALGLGPWAGFVSCWLVYFWMVVIAVEAIAGANIVRDWLHLGQGCGVAHLHRADRADDAGQPLFGAHLWRVRILVRRAERPRSWASSCWG